MNSNLFAQFHRQFHLHPKKPLIITTDNETTNGLMLEQQTAAMAHVLSSIGIQPGDRISVQIEKSMINVVLYLAALRIGAIYLPLNTAYTDTELLYFLQDAEPALHVCRTERFNAALKMAEQLPSLIVTTLNVDTPDPENPSLWQECLSAQEQCRFYTHITHRQHDDIAAILYTSGTTGKPKGAMISHGNLAANIIMLQQAWHFTEQDVLLHALPLFHVHGLFVALNLALSCGSTIQLLPAFKEPLVLAALPFSTVMMGVPTYYTRLLSNPAFQKNLCSNIRLFISGSAPLLESTFNAFCKRTGHSILERYGMTETGMSCSNPLQGERRAGTVGPALPGVKTRIVKKDGALAQANEVGQLQVQGDHVFRGYWKRLEKTREEFTGDGFFMTGDLASRSPDHYISIIGRGKDLIITGGLNVYPKEIEDVLNQHPQVIESAVIGVPHSDFGESIVAVIVGQPDLDIPDIQALCRTTLASFKQPKTWHQVNELPRNTMGKVQKNQLREQYHSDFLSKSD